jgi:hypothetical protein
MSDTQIILMVKNMAREMVASVGNADDWMTKVSSSTRYEYDDIVDRIEQIKDSGARRAMEMFAESWEKNTAVKSESQSALDLRGLKQQVDRELSKQK